MRKILYPLLTIAFILSQVDHLQAQGDVHSIIKKSIQAHGGEAQVAKLKVMRIKVSGKGSFLPGRGDVHFTLEDTWQMPHQYKSVLRFELDGQTFIQTQVLNNDRGWVNVNGQTQPLAEASFAEIKEQKYAEDLDRLLDLRNSSYKLSALEEVKIDGRSAIGIKVRSEGHRDVKLYFDKISGFLVKREQQITGDAGKLVSQEVFFRDYKEKDGLKHWMRLEAHRDGKKFLEAEVTGLEFFKKLSDSEFAKP